MILALDYGSRYVGVAITDPDGAIALRHSVIDQKERDGLGEIAALVDQEKVTKVLVGVPVGLHGQETEQTHTALRFIEALRDKLGPDVEVEGVDETLTSVEASQRLVAEGGKPEEEHAEAARLMLESFLRLKPR